jgi:hypothetical protein
MGNRPEWIPTPGTSTSDATTPAPGQRTVRKQQKTDSNQDMDGGIGKWSSRNLAMEEKNTTF